MKIVWLVAAMFGSALTVASFMKLIHAVFLGRPDSDFAQIREAGAMMVLPVAILAAICVIFGVAAFAIPLPVFITPAVGPDIPYFGAWHPVAATVLILAGLAAGALGYIAFGAAGFRRTDAFIGGGDPDKLGRIDGTAFYNTVTDIRLVGSAVRREGRGGFDAYSILSAFINAISRPPAFLHNGILPTYMIWSLLGLAGMILFVFLR
jgi:NADH:ubiquinone oxidoreductase subunit 5 (subunit L)/multisubunit Na+/H+ antiporter MnhA subunit